MGLLRLYHRRAIKYCTAAHLANVLPVVRVSVIWSDKIEHSAAPYKGLSA